MAFSALPFSPLSIPIETHAAEVKTKSITIDGKGVFAQDSSRYSTVPNTNTIFDFNIVNDGYRGNFSFGFVSFNISSISNFEAVESATYSFKTKRIEGREELPLACYYATKNIEQLKSKNGHQSFGNSELSTNIIGSTTGKVYAGQEYINNTKNYLGLEFIKDVAVEKDNVNFYDKEVDIASAINAALKTGQDHVILVFMFTKCGEQETTTTDDNPGSKGGWSDTTVRIDTGSITANTVTDYSYTGTASSSVNYVKKNIESFSGYTGTVTSHADGNVTTSNLLANPTNGILDKMSNVIYSAGTSSATISAFARANAIGSGTGTYSMFFALQYGNMVFLYDGVNECANVVMNVVKVSAGEAGMRNLVPRTSGFEIKNNWHSNGYYSGQSGVTATQYSNSGTYNYGPVNGAFIRIGSLPNDTYNRYFFNTLYYTGTPTSTVTTFDTLSWLGTIYSTNSKGDGNIATVTYNTPNIYVINYKPIYDQINAVKQTYQKVKENGDSAYCAEGLSAYYEAVKKVIELNPYDTGVYNYSSDISNAITTLGNNIDDVVNNYLKIAITEPIKHTATNTVHNDATCTTNEMDISVCSSCAATYTIEIQNTALGHDWGEIYSINDRQHGKECSRCNTVEESYHSFVENSTEYRRIVIPADEINNGYYYFGCKYCDAMDTINPDNNYGKVYLETDWSAYNAQVTIANDEIANTAKYTEKSRNAVSDIINSVTPNVQTKSQAYIDGKVTELKNAIEALKLNQYSITVNYFNENGTALGVGENGATSKTYPAVDYGSVQNVVAPTSYDGKQYIVYKWTRDSQGNNTISGLNSSSLGVVVKGNSTYYVYLKNATVDSSTANTTAIVKLNNKSNKVVDVGYVNKGAQTVTVKDNTIKLTDSNNNTVTLNAPNYSFYTLSGFTVNGKTVTSGSTVQIDAETVIKPVYAPKDTITITVGSGVAGGNVSTSWDSRVKLTSTLKPASNQVIKWTANINGAAVIWGYGETLSFQATQSCTVRCELISKDMATPSVSVDYVSYNLYKANTITAVSRIAVPEGYTVVEYGTILKTSNNLNSTTPSLSAVESATYKKTNAGGVFKATQQITGTNQFAMNFFAATDYEEMYVGAVAYLVYKQANSNTEYVIYSNTNGGKVVTSSYNKTAVGNN